MCLCVCLYELIVVCMRLLACLHVCVRLVVSVHVRWCRLLGTVENVLQKETTKGWINDVIMASVSWFDCQ